MTNLSDLILTITEVPANKRQWDGNITAYHIAKVENVETIKSNGLKTIPCYQGHDRREVVYFFLESDFSQSNILTLLGKVHKYAVITLSIPADEIKNMGFTGLRNTCFNFLFGAAMIYRNVPANWIEKVEYRNT